jgi:uncharacterized phage protein (TIGR01671 family)
MRTIKFRAWDEENKRYYLVRTINTVTKHVFLEDDPNDTTWIERYEDVIIEQFTGLLDKNGLIDIYEGDIMDEEGNIRGNIHETSDKRETDIIASGMGTSTWRGTEQRLLGCGCKYAL